MDDDRGATREVLAGWLGHMRVRSWPSAAAVAGAMGLLGYVGQNQAVLLPMIEREIDLRTVYAVVVVIVVCVPLQVTLPDLAPTLPREQALRVIRPFISMAMLAAFFLVSVPWGAWAEALPDARLAVVLLTAALIAGTFLGPRSWIVPFGAGLGALVLDGSHAQPVTETLAAIGLGPLGAVLALAVVVTARVDARGAPRYD